MPVIEGSRLKTGDDGRAEVEFEDGRAPASFRIAKSSSPALRSVTTASV